MYALKTLENFSTIPFDQLSCWMIGLKLFSKFEFEFIKQLKFCVSHLLHHKSLNSLFKWLTPGIALPPTIITGNIEC